MKLPPGAKEKSIVIGAGKYGGNFQRIRATWLPLFDGAPCPIPGCGRIMAARAPRGAPNKAELDHIDPNGPSVEENLQFICSACNSRKQANLNYVADNPRGYPPGYGVVPGSEDGNW